MVLLTQFCPHCAFETPNLQNYFRLNICMLLSAMCSHMVLLTQFYPQYAFQTPNLENYFHLSIFMLLGQCVHTLCFWYTLKPPIWTFFQLSIFMLLRAMCSHMVLLTQFYHHSAFQTPNQEYSGYLSIFMLRRAMCAHMALLTRFYSQCAFETLNLHSFFI